MKIATIPVGYDNGYPRSLSNAKGCAYQRKAGKNRRKSMYAPVHGRCDRYTGAIMDRVILIGKDGKHEITVEELSKLSGRFNYEFVCCLGKRIPRVYTGGDFDLMK